MFGPEFLHITGFSREAQGTKMARGKAKPGIRTAKMDEYGATVNRGSIWILPQNGWFIMENPMNKWMIWRYHYFWKHPITLPETNMFEPENGWLEEDRFLLGWPIFRGELLVSRRVISTRVSCWTWSYLVRKLVYFTYLRDVNNLYLYRGDLIHLLSTMDIPRHPGIFSNDD